MSAQRQDRYFIKVGENSQWQEVTKEDYVSAERGAGFHNTMGRPDEPATAGFGNGHIHGSLSYGGVHLPEDFIPLKGDPMNKMMTPEQFHADLVRQFNEHCEAARKGEVKPFSFLEEEGIDYNGWIEHRNAWPLTEDLLCSVSLTSLDDLEDPLSGLEVPFDECGTCSRLVDMYRDYCSKYRITSSRERRKAESE
jgi:hypothetical protein